MFKSCGMMLVVLHGIFLCHRVVMRDVGYLMHCVEMFCCVGGFMFFIHSLKCDV